MAGLKHANVAQGRADQACGEIRRLPPAEVEKTLEFVSGLVSQRGEAKDPGKPERLLELQGTWSFKEGERAALLEELRRMRSDSNSPLPRSGEGRG